jgi:hypothetical protein
MPQAHVKVKQGMNPDYLLQAGNIGTSTKTLQQLQSLRLNGMYQHYREVLNLPANEHPTGHELLAMLVQARP